jgi:uncharacterized protein YcgI (DUF1989 family)
MSTFEAPVAPRGWQLIEKVVVPAAEGASIQVAPRQVLRVIDLEGGQVASLVAMRADDPTEFLDTTRTRNILGRSVLKSGDRMFTNRRTPAFVLVRDDVGRHDLAFAACDARLFAQRFNAMEHANCLSNFTRVLEPDALPWWRIPNPANLFQNSPVQPDGSFAIGPSTSQPGDTVELLSLLRMVVAVSACPDDCTGVNRGAPTPIGLQLWQVS